MSYEGHFLSAETYNVEVDSAKPKETLSCIPSEKNALLISEVKKFSSLYDTSDPNYYLLSERNKAWLKVAKNCGERAELCHLRWRSLRKRYAKEKRKFPEILKGHRRPWALFPKMSFLTSATTSRPKSFKSRIRPERRNLNIKTEDSVKRNASEDDMLIVGENDEIIHTCKSVEISEEDDYIYDTLDDPDSALEIMKNTSSPKVKATAIRSAGPSFNGTTATARIRSGRVRKLTPKMQNLVVAKKLRKAQNVLQRCNSSVSNNAHTTKTTVQRAMSANNKSNSLLRARPNPVSNSVLYKDQTTRHVATVNPNNIRIEKAEEKGKVTGTVQSNAISSVRNEFGSPAAEESKPFKIIKVTGRNPIIFSPERLPEIQTYLKSGTSPQKDEQNLKSPVIKVKSVDNLNNERPSGESGGNGGSSESGNNLDIIHSVGLMRKADKTGSQTSSKSYSKSYSWNKPKVVNKQTYAESIQCEAQTTDYEIEETWNDIKQEHIDEDYNWANPQGQQDLQNRDRGEDIYRTPPARESPYRASKDMWNRVNEAKLDLIAYQRTLLEEQHKKNLEYMKREHDLKMTLLKAEIDLKRKQFNMLM